MSNVVISGTGVYTPPNAVSNDDLVGTYNEYAEKYNTENAAAIEAGELDAKAQGSAAFIEKASGIKNRYFMESAGILDATKMTPGKPEMMDDDRGAGIPVQTKMAFEAAKEALDKADLTGEDIDLVIISASIWERFFPSMAVQLQEMLGSKGHAFDMAMACSSATFGISTAMDSILSGMANKALVITSEYLSPIMNYTDRDSHFIFGDAAVAMVLEREEESTSNDKFRIKTRELFTTMSTNIRAGFGTRALLEREAIDDEDIRFKQNGRQVFKELLPLVINLVRGHLDKHEYTVADMRRMWLHQANINMNQYATKKLLGTDSTQDVAPIILDEFANTAGAGCMIAFHKYHDDIKSGELGLICSFGASYSIGCMIVEKV